LLAWLVCVASATAQPLYRPGSGLTPSPIPTVSPYLNLLRQGNPPYLNYYGLVRPEQRFNTALGTLQQQSAINTEQITDLDATLAAPVTGHRTYFLNSSRYFLTQGAAGTTSALPGGTTGGAGTGQTSVYYSGSGLYRPPTAGRSR
jgi:hypothetical protein